METLEKIFSDEREARIAQGLLKTLSGHRRPTRVFELMEDSLQPICELVGEDYARRRDGNYRGIVETFCAHGLVTIRDSNGQKRQLNFVNDEIQITEQGIAFYEKHHMG